MASGAEVAVARLSDRQALVATGVGVAMGLRFFFQVCFIFRLEITVWCALPEEWRMWAEKRERGFFPGLLLCFVVLNWADLHWFWL